MKNLYGINSILRPIAEEISCAYIFKKLPVKINGKMILVEQVTKNKNDILIKDTRYYRNGSH